jgi:pyruvate,water dikinase
MSHLIRFEDELALDARVVGQKFYSLARAFRAGFAVPQAVAINTDAHRYYLANNTWPEGLAEDVLAAAHALDISQGLSIRSSATREDLEKQSFAGQYRSFLQVVGKDDIIRNIEACWKSVGSETVRSYLQAQPPSSANEDTPLMAVVIQKMVAARVAGIAFGRNPMKPTRNEVVIEAVEGLGENLVSGHRTPYRAVVDENGEVEVIPPDSENRLPDNTDRMLHQHSFWREIARRVKAFESHNGRKPLDIEWAVDDRKKFWLLQSRIITTLDESASRIPPGLWTRKIANDLWADRLTPFLAHHMLKNAPRFDLSRTLTILGLPVIRPTLTVIHGYLYLNGDSIKKGISYIPPGLRLPQLGSLLPASIDLGRAPAPSILTLFAVIIRSLLLPVLEPGVNPLICLWRAKHDLKSIERQIVLDSTMSSESSRMTMNKIQAVLATLTRLQVKNQWPYFHATFFTWIFRWLAVDRLNLSHAEFLRFLGEGASNISIEIEQKCRKMANEMARDPDMVDLFKQRPSDRLAEELPPSIRADLNDFLSRYGCRSRHRTLFIKRWSESPQEVIGILQSLVQNQVGLHELSRDQPKIAGSDSNGTANPGAVSSPDGDLPSKDGAVSIIGRLCLRLMTRMTRRFLDLREELRFALDRILFLMRQTLLTLGDQTGLGERIMFLNEDELADLVQGRLPDRQARRRANSRYEEFVRPFEGATFYHDGMAEDEFQSGGAVITGIGTSPGRASGRARIVVDPTRADIKKGDILITKNTDPGWTPILSIVGGMVMEEGGLLNHCSIVARELGVPSIVGVRGATRRIPDNSKITIDGGMGAIWLED